jgi:putative membrane protein
LNTPDKGAWQRTSPFAILFFLGRILRLIAKNAWQSLAPLFAFLVAYQGDIVNKLIVGGVLLATVIVVGAVLSWLFFSYQIGDDSILIRSGVFKKKQLDIKFDRIQGVNAEQNPVYRFLNLVTVTFDTAGSSGNEGNLPAVTREFANSLREQIGRGQAEDVIDEEQPAAHVRSLLKLDWRDMIRIGLADRRALIVFALIGPLFDQMGDRIKPVIESAVESVVLEALQLGIGAGAAIALIIVFGVTLLFVLISVAAAFLRFHNLEVFLDGHTLRSVGGLLTRHEHAMDLQKIQTLRSQQGIVQSGLGRYTLTARQAISGRRGHAGKMFTRPVVTATMVDQLRPLMLAPAGGRLTQDPRSHRFQPVSRYYLRSRILYLGALPATILATIFTAAEGPVGLLALIWIPLVSLVSWRNWRRAGYLHDDNELVCRSGLLGYRTVALLFRKVQRVTVTQSRFQRRKHLASLRLYMASGSVRVPYIALTSAQQLRDYILYKVETSQQAWH